MVAGSLLALAVGRVGAVTQQQSSSVGIQGTVAGSPPTQTPTISIPANGQSFSSIPITVSGLCQNGTLVEVFTNGVFAGSRECANGSFSIQIDLFSGRNDLIARDYDALNQSSPDSKTVTVTFNSGLPSTAAQLTLTTQYAKRGADPGSTLDWPITLSGGTGPYAINVDWGDNSLPYLLSQKSTGNISLEHIYKTAGIYNITIQASDSSGQSAFLQLVGIGNGPIQQAVGQTGKSATKVERVAPWWAIVLLFILVFISFWLGKQHQLQSIRVRLRRGQPPFG